MIFGGRYITTSTQFGGNGSTYICQDPNLERLVAIKFIQHLEERKIRDLLGVLRAIRSKNVAQVLDMVREPKLGIGVVSEYLTGVDLTDPASLPQSELDLLKLVFQLANGLKDIHGFGVTHGDLSPRNVKYTDENILKIFDFEVSFGHTSPISPFVAPERQVGSSELTPAIDVYSLAAIVGFVVDRKNGMPLVHTLQQNITAKRFGAVEWLNAELSTILDAALRRNPTERPTAADIFEVSRRLLTRNKHRASLTIPGTQTVYCLNESNCTARIAYTQEGGCVEVKYNGLEFIVESIRNAVLINGIPCIVGQRLPDSCVIDLGNRKFVTFDISHPEVIL